MIPRVDTPRTVWKPHAHWLIDDRLGLMKQVRSENCLSGQRRGPAAPEDDKIPRPDQTSFLLSTIPTPRGRKQWSPCRCRPARVGNLNRAGWLLAGVGLWNQRAAGVTPRENFKVPPHSGRINPGPWTRDTSLHEQLQPLVDENVDPRAAIASHVAETSTSLPDC